MEKLRKAIADQVCEVLMEIGGGEDDTPNALWRHTVTKLKPNFVSLANKKTQHAFENCVDGKPNDIEVRSALTMFHRFRSSPKSKLKTVSNHGLERSFASPKSFANTVATMLEERCSNLDLCHYVKTNSSGIICIVSSHRNNVLREAGRLPCPQCTQWLKGEKGLWWHQQQKHGKEHSIATASAAGEKIVLAMVPYSPNKLHVLASPFKSPGQKQVLRETNEVADAPWDAIKTGDLEAVKRFVQKGFRPNKEIDKKGASPLMWAAGGGHLELVKILIHEYQCDPNEGQKGKRSFSGRTALHWSARNGRLPVVEYLVDHCRANLEACTVDGTTAFAWASWQAHLEVMQFLAKRGANVQAKNSFGCNAVLWCAQGRGDVKTMNWLRTHGCDVTLFNENRHGVLHKAAQRGNKEIIGWMIDVILNLLQSSLPKLTRIALLDSVAPDSEGCMPSDLAGMEGHEDLANYIVSQERNVIENAYTTFGMKEVLVIASSWMPSDTVVVDRESSSPNIFEPWAGVKRIQSACVGTNTRI